MKLSKIYKSNKFNSKIIVILLFIFFLQVIYYFGLNNRINLPGFVKDIIIYNLFSQNKFDVGNISFQFPNRVYIEKAKFITEKEEVIFNEIEFKFKNIINDDYIESLFIESTIFSSDLIGNIIISDFQLLSNSQIYNINFEFLSEQITIYSKGIIRKKIKKNINNTSDIKKTLLNQLLKKLKLFKPNRLKLSGSKFKCFFDLSENGYIYINQENPEGNNEISEGLSLIVNLSRNLNISNISAKMDLLNIKSLNNQFQVNGIEFNFLNSFSNSNRYDLKFQSLKSNGLFEGSFPNLKLHCLDNHKAKIFHLFSDSNTTKFSNKFIFKNNKIKKVSGFNTIFPSFLNLKILAHNQYYNLFNGKLLKLNFYNSCNSHSQYSAYLKLKSKQFSALESPLGDYNASGTINNDFSISLRDINCIMGNSIVSGSYYQSWDPYFFDFKVNGKCLPTDINNWFGDWWDEVWLDFKFNNNYIPTGNFIISGAWNSEHKTSAFGLIRSKKISYKGLSINDTKIFVSVNKDTTKIKSEYIKHNKGKLSGSFSLKNNSLNQISSLSYKINGDFPLNDAKKTLGSYIENHLKDFNINKVRLNSEGNIPLQFKITDDINIKNFNYIIDFATDENGTWNGINFKGVEGKLWSNFSQTNINIPKIGFANGNLSFNLIIDNNNSKIDINTEISSGNLREISKSVKNFNVNQNQLFDGEKLDFFSESGKLDFDLKATGSSFNITDFSGTGKIKVVDKGLSKIKLLGFLSDALSNLPIPIPSGTLKFNHLEGLYELRNRKIIFDKLILSGLISKIENRGQFNFVEKEIDIISKIYLIGNLPIPFLKQLAKIADPLSSIAEIRLTGPWLNPKWRFSF